MRFLYRFLIYSDKKKSQFQMQYSYIPDTPTLILHSAFALHIDIDIVGVEEQYRIYEYEYRMNDGRERIFYPIDISKLISSMKHTRQQLNIESLNIYLTAENFFELEFQFDIFDDRCSFVVALPPRVRVYSNNICIYISLSRPN